MWRWGPMGPTTSRERLEAAFEASPRQWFLPSPVRERWGEDRPLPLPRGMTNSQPSTVWDMLALLDVPVGARVLDIGAGSGWTTALLAHLVGPAGTVLGLEIEPELVTLGQANLARCEREWARIELAEPDVLGRPQEAPFDRILVSAMAREVPDTLLDQLADDGVMVVPVDGRMLRVTAGEPPRIERFGHYRFVPLR